MTVDDEQDNSADLRHLPPHLITGVQSETHMVGKKWLLQVVLRPLHNPCHTTHLYNTFLPEWTISSTGKLLKQESQQLKKASGSPWSSLGPSQPESANKNWESGVGRKKKKKKKTESPSQTSRAELQRRLSSPVAKKILKQAELQEAETNQAFGRGLDWLCQCHLERTL